MRPTNLLLAFAPLLLFTILGRVLGMAWVGWVALASALLAAAILLTGIRQGVKLVTAGSVVVFAVLASVALFGGPTGRHLVAVFGSGICALAIGALMLISVVTVPFTEQYARHTVPKRFWTAPEFKKVNKRISLVWAGVVLGIGVCRIVQASLAVSVARLPVIGELLLSWVIPIILVFVGLTATRRIANHASDVDQPAHPRASS